jgi:squalene cyclase
MRPLAALLAVLALATGVRAAAPPTVSVQRAVEMAMKRIEKGLVAYPKQRQCFSCHHHAVAVFSFTEAKRRGFEVDEKFVKTQIDFSLKTFRNRSQISKGAGVGGDSTSVAYMLNTLAAVERPHDETTTALVEYLLVKQRKDGSWPVPVLGDNRPPTMGSLFTNAGLALSALKAAAPPKESKGAESLQKRIDTAFAKGRNWLLANKPSSNEDRVFHLWGLAAAGVESKHLAAAREGLLKKQNKDGSWAQLPNMSGDAYATATALVALRKGGLDTKSEPYQRGVRYLLDTQTADGVWIVQTRAKPLQRFFDNGDAGGKSQFISFAATNWAVMALLETLPVQKG